MLADHFDAFLIDLDGVVRIGSEPAPGAISALRRLRQRGRFVRFVTNDPRPTREHVLGELRGLDIEVHLHEIVTAGWATAHWLRRQGRDRVHVVGSRGLAQELIGQGLDVTEEDAQVVVVGCDENLSYRDIERAAALIDRGARFVATNADASFPGPTGPRPATGAILAALAAATGQEPDVIGKPAAGMFEIACRDLPASARTVVVGDSLDTDVLGAHRAGLPAIHVVRRGASEAMAHSGRAEASISGLAGLFDPNISIHESRAEEPPRPGVVLAAVAAIVLNDDGMILLGRRADNGQWGLPSGHVEAGETVTDAVLREVREETGLVVAVDRMVGVYSDPWSQDLRDRHGQLIRYVTTAFACRPVGGNLAPDHVETTDLGFFAPEQFPDDLLRMHPTWLADALSGVSGVVR